ncbi:MAG: carbon storage regulator [Planctomycetaceae bacterium]
MLVLSRKQNETIVLPDLNLTIRVTGISGGRVRLAVEAPQEIRVMRHEVLSRPESCRPASRPTDSTVLV